MTHLPFSLYSIEAALTAVVDGDNPDNEPELAGCQVDRYQYMCDKSHYVHVQGDNSDLLMSLLELADRGDLSDSWAIQQGEHNPTQVWFSWRDHLDRTSLVVFTIFPELAEILSTHKSNRIRFGPGITLAPPENHVELNAQGREILADDLDNRFIPF